MARRDYGKGSLPFAFVPVPREVLLMPEYQNLPASAKALMLDVAAQYTGKNNGRLTPCYEAMQRCGWNSKSKLQRAKEALLGAPFVVLTRKGHPPRTVDWLAFTWWKLDFDRSMDSEIDPRSFPFLNFVPAKLADPNAGRQRPAKQVLSPRIGGVSTGKVMLCPPELGGLEVMQ